MTLIFSVGMLQLGGAGGSRRRPTLSPPRNEWGESRREGLQKTFLLSPTLILLRSSEGEGANPVGVSPTIPCPHAGTVRKPAAVAGCATSVADGKSPVARPAIRVNQT